MDPSSFLENEAAWRWYGPTCQCPKCWWWAHSVTAILLVHKSSPYNGAICIQCKNADIVLSWFGLWYSDLDTSSNVNNLLREPNPLRTIPVKNLMEWEWKSENTEKMQLNIDMSPHANAIHVTWNNYRLNAISMKKSSTPPPLPKVFKWDSPYFTMMISCQNHWHCGFIQIGLDTQPNNYHITTV